MKKLPTVFLCEYQNGRSSGAMPLVRPGLEWVLNGTGVATVKVDGSACAVIDGVFYKRYDAKHGKSVPKNALPCQEKPDEVTGHFPCWLPCNREEPGDKWHWAAYDAYVKEYGNIPDGTYEAIGKHFQSNPYGLQNDILVPHGEKVVEVPRTFSGIKAYLTEHNIEGLVFWKGNEPKCKIRKKDFRMKWPDILKPVESPFVEDNDQQ